MQAAPSTTGVSTVFIQSMAYDHNTGKLYHANYGYNEAGNGYVGRLQEKKLLEEIEQEGWDCGID